MAELKMSTLKKAVLFFFCLHFIQELKAQSTFPSNGAPDVKHTYYAFTNCNVYIDPNTFIKSATLLVQNNTIIEIGTNLAFPVHAVQIDLKGKYVYPAFIESYSNLGMPETKTQNRGYNGPQMESSTKGAYNWNQAIKPETEAHKLYSLDEAAADELRKLGFGTALTFHKDGIIRGSSCVVALNGLNENEGILKDKAAGMYSFRKGTSTQDYPESLMGSIALLRQTFYNLDWYKSSNKKEYDISLEALQKLIELPSIFEVNSKLSALRASKIGNEFKIPFIIKGSGDEYQRINELKKNNLKFILPLNFPEAMDVEDPYDAEMISLSELKHWEMAPSNPSRLQSAGIPFAISSCDLKERKNFLKNLRKAVKYGLSETDALKALTQTPAQFLKIEDKAGSLKKGMPASFFIASKNIFDESAVILETWVSGQRYIYSDLDKPETKGEYEFLLEGKKYKAEISGEQENPSLSVYFKDTVKTKTTFNLKNSLVTISINKDSTTSYRMSGTFDQASKVISGKAQDKNGNWSDFSLVFTQTLKESDEKTAEKKTQKIETGDVYYPFTAYGKPEKEEDLTSEFKNRTVPILIKKITVWTNETEGILKEKDVLIQDGKIAKIEDDIDVSAETNTKVIDGKGKHLTPGIIDEHSHIAINEGVNEGTQASTAEVRIGDVVNSEDVNIYRQLAGGVTTVQQLHGSANPIGGQSSILKLRWGLSPEQMKFEGSDGFIKFALGENVKQSNWGDMNRVRFPQTRMGVEQVYYDHFIRAREYDAKWKAFQISKDKNKVSPRRDLELDALAEILNKKRFITCHSYVQSEINMLMHVADSMGFTVNTFTHILEGYKVADKMKKHGVAASTFADWWAYKMEVMDAIPYNASILSKMGVITAINSDDAEMARRLNQEAAKAVKYGNLSEEEALKLVTLNPAKMLHLDSKVGSIKVGKVADVVVWSDHPLSVQAKAEKTLVDGIIYFDCDEDKKLREQIKVEKARIVAKMMGEKNKGAKLEKPTRKKQILYHCDTKEGEDSFH